MDTLDISWWWLLAGHALLLLPIGIFVLYKAPLIKSTLIATVRMAVQLILVGFYLEYLFRWNNAWINSAWVVVMLLVGGLTSVQKSYVKYRYFLWPVTISMALSLIITDTFLLGVVVKLPHLLDARYLIPISGMILGNSLGSVVLALQVFYDEIKQNEAHYHFLLACGASRQEALLPAMQKTLKKVFNPVIAKMSVIGLISLPGTMTGQIIGGSSPLVAIKYQILLMVAIFTASVVMVFLTILLANRAVFDAMDNLKADYATGNKKNKKPL